MSSDSLAVNVYDKDMEYVASYASIYKCSIEMMCSAKSVKAALESGNIFKGYYYKYANRTKIDRVIDIRKDGVVVATVNKIDEAADFTGDGVGVVRNCVSKNTRSRNGFTYTWRDLA